MIRERKEQLPGSTYYDCSLGRSHKLTGAIQWSILTLFFTGKPENTMPIFDHTHLKSIKVTFSFPEVASICKKSVCSIYSFLKYS